MSKFPGIHRTAVRENADPQNRRRLLVEIPGATGNALAWAEACVTSDAMRVPAPGDMVWVMFEHGDADHPVWLGVVAVHA